MRKAIILGLAGVFLSSAALACNGGLKSASSGAQQSVMTDQGSGHGGMTVKPDSKG